MKKSVTIPFKILVVILYCTLLSSSYGFNV